MIEGLNKETLKRLYAKERKSLQEIARIFNCSTTGVAYRCEKYGIKRRPRAEEVKGLSKSILQRLYIKESKSLNKIAEMVSCSPSTVQNRCMRYGIKLRRPEESNKAMLHKLYVKEGKTIRDIAKILNCSREFVRIRCKKFGIELRPRNRKLEVDESILRRLCFKEGKSTTEISEMFDCAVSTISKRVKQFGLNKEL